MQSSFPPLTYARTEPLINAKSEKCAEQIASSRSTKRKVDLVKSYLNETVSFGQSIDLQILTEELGCTDAKKKRRMYEVLISLESGGVIKRSKTCSNSMAVTLMSERPETPDGEECAECSKRQEQIETLMRVLKHELDQAFCKIETLKHQLTARTGSQQTAGADASQS
jgi:hypothetical protein